MASREQLPTPALVAFTSVGYFALLVAGLGVGSMAADADVITTQGLSVIAAYIAAAAAIGGFALFLIGPASRDRPSYWHAASTAVGSAAVHVLTLGIVALVETGDLGVVGGVVSEVLLGWVSPVVFGTAAVAAWAAIALRRTKADRPQWPWEHE